MKQPFVSRSRRLPQQRHGERGVTFALVALAMFAVIALAALSIDVATLYLARAEAQRASDNAALTAARMISMSGITGDPTNATGSWQPVCGPSGTATVAAEAVGAQNLVGGAGGTVNVTYSAGTTTGATDCSTLASATSAFGVNPLVSVTVQRTSLPTFFARMWGNTSNTVSATSMAEAFNPSNSASVGNGASGSVIPVWPRCVKPWAVPNLDPLNPSPTCPPSGPGACQPFVSLTNGQIVNPGVLPQGSGVVGESFWLIPDCHMVGSGCTLRSTGPTGIQANYTSGFHGSRIPLPPNLEYLPGYVAQNSTAIPSCSVPRSGSYYEPAIAGCDQTTQYQCGTQNANQVDLSEDPGPGTNDTMNGVECLIHQSSAGLGNGQDALVFSSAPPNPPPPVFPFEIQAGSSNPLGVSGNLITDSNSIVSLPIFDNNANPFTGTRNTNITVVGFLQVFVDQVDDYGDVQVTVLNVAGCGNGLTTPVSTSPVYGTSPVPVRLVTPPVPSS